MMLLAAALFLAVYTSTGRFVTSNTASNFIRSPPLGLCSPVLIGNFKTYQHLVSGTVYADNNSTIRIENFNYDGLGPGGLP